MELREGYKNTEVGVIPDDWDIKSILDIIQKNAGIKIGPFGSQLKKDLLVERGYKIYGQENVFEKDFDIGNRYLSEEHFRRLKTCELLTGDFIISMMGTIGKCMIVPRNIESGIMDSHLLRLKLNDTKINSELLIHFFSSQLLKNQVKRLSVGGIMDGLSSSIVKKIQFSLPKTLSEQQAIAEVLSDTDILIQALEKQIAKKSNIMLGAMQKLLQPKEGWEVKKLGEIAKIVRGASPRPIEDPKWFDESSSIGWVRISDVTKSVKILTSTTQKLSELGIQSSRYVEEGNLIMSICATVGRPILTRINVCIHDGFVVFRNPTIEKEYLYYFLSFIEKDWSKNGQTGSQMNLNTPLINSTEIAIPPTIKEQTTIATILSDIDNEITALESNLKKYKMLKLGMMQNLLTGKIRLIKS